ncbi:MAG: rhodanese-like domain-containing protein [Clostridiales Family XIII bacterium]|nr:rhodanese-like domain-containing protein [Clostridiales Family XIII bacterium]
MLKHRAAVAVGIALAVCAALAFLVLKLFPIIGAGSEAAAWPQGEGPVSARLSAGDVEGYLSSEYVGNAAGEDVFLACGTGGRLDRIYQDGRTENVPTGVDADLTRVFKSDGALIVAGASGTILYSGDGESFEKCEVPLNSDILGLARFNGVYYACAADGSVIASKDGRAWEQGKRPVKRPIISIAANDAYLMAVTAEGDVIVSQDGEEWNVQNFNEYYKGYYDEYVFVNLVNLGPTFFVLAYVAADPGVPAIMFTDSGGEIWQFKALSEIDDKDPAEYFPLRINYIGVFESQLMAVCDGGRLLTVTECSVCNTISQVSGADLYAMALSDENLLTVGRGFEYAVLKNRDLRQDEIGAAQALEDFQAGAVIIDVRTEEEYNELRIKGSIHIPVDEIEDRLPVEIPDLQTELIFYCEKGVRSQTALEKAQELGYMNVYNLGGIGDWPYETEF